MASRRILYAGENVTLPGLLKDPLKGLDCFLVRSPIPGVRALIQSEIEYSLFLFDGTAAGAELERYARTLPHREHTPVIIMKESEGPGRLLDIIRRRLGTGRVR